MGKESLNGLFAEPTSSNIRSFASLRMTVGEGDRVTIYW